MINKYSKKTYIGHGKSSSKNCKKLTKEEICESINDGLSDVSSLEGQAEIDNEKISQHNILLSILEIIYLLL